MVSKKTILPVMLGVLLVAVIAGLYIAVSRPTLPRPNMHVLLITLDTTRADRLGCYGYVKPTSPNLDKLAAESVQFDLAIAQAAVTPPSHASILTGLDPYNHRLRVLHGLVENRLAEKHWTLAEIWQEVGGQTAAFVSAFPVTGAFGLDQGFEHFDARFPQTDGKGLVSKDGVVNTGRSQRRAKETTGAAVEWLDEKADPDTPLFMWVHYFDPHDPFLLPPQVILDKFSPISLKREDRLRAIYDGEVFYMDLYVGELLEAFKERGLWDNTIVVVVADHGEGLGDHDWWSHGILYQEQIRVPLIIRVPGVKGGLRVPSLVRTIDLMPTVLEAAGVCPEVWPSVDGESLMKAMQTGRTANQRIAYADSVNILTYGRPDAINRRDKKNDKLYCLTDGKHKLIYHQLEPDKTEFFSLQADPLERNNLAASKPPAMQEFMNRLEGLNAFSNIMPGITPSDMERVKKLRDLGYVQ
jgi:arylsulfatase A-like enzyme